MGWFSGAARPAADERDGGIGRWEGRDGDERREDDSLGWQGRTIRRALSIEVFRPGVTVARSGSSGS